MPKHTPGPWRYYPSGNIYDMAANLLAKVTPPRRPEHARQVDANGALIAAAPDLLAALEKMVADCVCDDGQIEYQPSGIDGWLPTGDSNIVTDPCPYCQNARAAIDKAKGQEAPR